MSARLSIVVAAARRMNQLAATACGVDVDDSWAIYGDAYLNEAEDVLGACGALRLMDAARAYAMGYAQDEGADDGVDSTGCSQKQHEDAAELLAAVRKVCGVSHD